MGRIDAGWRIPKALVVASCITALLYFAQDVFVPLALAALLSFMLSPLVSILEHRGLKRSPAVLIITILSFSALGCLGWVMANQASNLAEHLPDYKENIEKKFKAINGRTGAILIRATKTITELSDNLDAPEKPPAARQSKEKNPPEKEPSAKVVMVKEHGPFELLQSMVSMLLGPLSKAAIVVILVVFMLMGWEDMRDRVIRIAGPSHINMATQALDDAGTRVSKYLIVQLGINSVYGVSVAAGLYLIGVPNALMWGLLSTLLRFLPYLGFWLAVAFPFLLALAAPGWYMPIATLALFGGLEFLTNNVEPALYGSSTGLSSIAVLASALFWAWIWGPIGLILSTPITVILVVMGKYIPQMELINIALGDEQALKPHERLYQRLLATDYDEAGDVFEEFAKVGTTAEAFDNIVFPALTRIEMDFFRGEIDEQRRKSIHENLSDLLLEYGALKPAADKKSGEEAKPIPAEPPAGVPVFCLPARHEADAIAATMLAQVLHKNNIPALALSSDCLVGEILDMIEYQSIDIVCISAVQPAAIRHARYLYKRIRARHPRIRIVVALWQNHTELEKSRRLIGSSDSDVIVTTLADATKNIASLAQLCSHQTPTPQLAHA